MYEQETISIATRGRGTHRIDDDITRVVARSGVITGLCHVFCHHTSASLILCENADPTVRRDLETFMARLVPDGDAMFEHDDEGPDDMPAHVRSILTQSSLHVPVAGGRLSLGTWQGIYLWEHRTSSHRRQVTITVHGASR
ncbi:MAG: YjbQ family protein [Gammaproteobacteria bacterium]|nr:YjbQ family protein [Gammaproteobacteria bacterium]